LQRVRGPERGCRLQAGMPDFRLGRLDGPTEVKCVWKLRASEQYLEVKQYEILTKAKLVFVSATEACFCNTSFQDGRDRLKCTVTKTSNIKGAFSFQPFSLRMIA
jgi:hypothetical protein